MRQPAEDLVLFQAIADGDLHGAVERQLAGVDPLQRGYRRAQYKAALEQIAAKAAPGGVDLSRQGEFLGSGQQRHLADLVQVYAERIVEPTHVAIRAAGQFAIGVFRDGLVVRRFRFQRVLFV